MNRFGVLNLLIAIGLIAAVNADDCSNPPARTDMKLCCPHDNLLSKDIIDKCKSYLDGADAPPTQGSEGGRGGPGGHGHGHHPPKCYFECALNETGIMNNNEVDEAKLKTYLSTVLSGSPDFIPIVQTAFGTCADKAKEMRAMMENNPRPSPPPGSNDKCKPCSAMLIHCVEIETMFNCPTSAWKNDDACNANREFMKNCKPQHPPHGKPPQ